MALKMASFSDGAAREKSRYRLPYCMLNVASSQPAWNRPSSTSVVNSGTPVRISAKSYSRSLVSDALMGSPVPRRPAREYRRAGRRRPCFESAGRDSRPLSASTRRTRCSPLARHGANTAVPMRDRRRARLARRASPRSGSPARGAGLDAGRGGPPLSD